MKYRREVDGLRALAGVPVMLFHAGFPLFGGGFVGVDVFFVISGYLITSILHSEMDQGTYSLASFYERRARRILPALFFVMLCCLPFSWAWLPPTDLKQFAQSLVAVTFFGSNFLFWLQTDYFGATAELKPLLHTWSLAVEEQYYLFFPLLLRWAWPLGRRKTVGLICILVIFSLVLAQWGLAFYPDAAFYLLPFRGWELLVGALAAIQLSDPLRAVPQRPIREAAAILGLGLILASMLAFNRSMPFPGIYASLPVFGTLLIILFADGDTFIGRLLGSRTLVGIGLVSFSAYLWHQPLFAFARIRMQAPLGSIEMAGLILLTLIFAGLSWRFIEQPFRSRTGVDRKQILWMSIMVSTLFCVLGSLGHVTKGFYEVRLDSAQKALLESYKASPMRSTCHDSDRASHHPASACRYQGEKVSWAVIGDSHAVELAYALAESLRAGDRGVWHFSYSGCPPVYARSDLNTGCRRWTDAAVSFIVAEPQIDIVVVSYRINMHLFGDHRVSYPSLPDIVGSEERLRRWNSYLGLIRAMHAAGKKVIVVLQAPELPKAIDQLIFQYDGNAHGINGASTAWWKERSAYLNEKAEALKSYAKVIDPIEEFCNPQWCLAGQAKEAFYFDDNHLSVGGASRLTKRILEAASE